MPRRKRPLYLDEPPAMSIARVVSKRRSGFVSIAMLAITVVIDAVAGVQSIFGAIEGEGERPGFDRKILARPCAVRRERASVDARRECHAHQLEFHTGQDR